MEKINEMDVMLRIVTESDTEIQQREIHESWEKVYAARQNRSIMKAKLMGIETIKGKACGVVRLGMIKGLLPLEYSGLGNINQLRNLVGLDIVFKVVLLDRQGETFIASRLEALDHLQGITWDKLRVGQKVIGTIAGLVRRDVVIEIGGIEVIVPTSELSYEWIDDVSDKYKIGDEIMVRVMELDKKEKLLKVSHKALLKNPWPDCTRRYNKFNEYVGKISGVMEYGVFVNLEPGVDCLTTHPSHDIGSVRKGDEVLIKIHNILMKEEKITAKVIRKLS